MKVLFLVKKKEGIGGVEKHLAEVGRVLRLRGHQIKIIDETSIIQKEWPIRWQWFKKFRIWWWFWQNRQLIEAADLVHSHDVAFWYFPFRFVYPKKKFYITFHGWEGKFPIPWQSQLVRKISAKLARGNICVGEYIKKYYSTRADYVTYGAIKVKSPAKGEARQGRQKEKVKSAIKNSKLISFIGRLEEDTGLPVYLTAIKSKEFKSLKFKIQFIGEGKMRKRVEKRGQARGMVKNLKKEIDQSRFIFTSGYLAILEAMARKRLVFAVYDNPLKEDYLRMSPLADKIVSSAGAGELLTKMDDYFNHPEKEKALAAKAYQWARRQTWSKVADLYEALWQK